MRIDAGLEPTARAAEDGISHWPMLIDRLVAECHPEQRDFVLDPARYIAALVGRGGGKTTGGQVRFTRRMLTRAGARCLFVAKTRDHARTLIWAETKTMFERLGFRPGRDITFNEGSLTATITRNGSSLRLVGADKLADLESLRGKTFHEVGIDEGASHSDKILSYLIKEVIGPRLVGALWIIGTAGKRLKGLFYDISRRGSTISQLWAERTAEWKLWSLHKWSLKSAIAATKHRPVPALLELWETQQLEIAAQRLTDDSPIKRREYDAEWAADESVNVYLYRPHDDLGNEWNIWDPLREGPLGLARLPRMPDGSPLFDDWIHIVVMDPGFSDPTAINVFSVAPADVTRTIYHRLCVEETGMFAQTIAHRLLGLELKHSEPGGIIGAIGTWPNVMVADSAHQMAEALLAELATVYGISIEPAKKGFRYKVGAIDTVNGDLFAGRIKVLKGSKLEDQLLDLQWDESATGEQIERRGAPNHSTDCLVYGRAAIANFITATHDETPLPKFDPRAPGYVPPFPALPDDDDLTGAADVDYDALLG